MEILCTYLSRRNISCVWLPKASMLNHDEASTLHHDDMTNLSVVTIEQRKKKKKFKFFLLYILRYRMHIIAIENAFSKGYHEIADTRIAPSAALLIPVTKEYRNRHEPQACFGMGTRNRANPRSLWNHVTDEKRHIPTHNSLEWPPDIQTSLT